jgi:drug/metabolite transporter (DMT)-like permease
VIAILGGLGAAVCWATATLCTSRSARMIGAPAVLGWVMGTGFVLLAPAVVATGMPAGVGPNAGWLALSGGANVLGLLAVYAGLRRGSVGVVAAIASTEGAVAAVIAAIAGERIGAATASLLALIAAGVFLAALGPGHGGERHPPSAALLATAAAASFGLGLYATGRVSDEVPLVWAVFPARLAGFVFVTATLAAIGRLHLTRRAAPLVLAAGGCEVLGLLSFALGSRHGIAVAAVLASQFAAIATVGAYLLFRERLGRSQLAGVVATIAGVAALTALRA